MLSPEVTVLGCGNYHSPPSSVKVKNESGHTSITTNFSMKLTGTTQRVNSQSPLPTSQKIKRGISQPAKLLETSQEVLRAAESVKNVWCKVNSKTRQAILRQAMYVQRNMKARSRSQSCRGKAINRYYVFWGCACSLKYPACNMHAPCRYVRPARLNNIFPHYLLNGTIFEKKKKVIEQKKCVFSLQLLSETFLVLSRIQRDTIIHVYWS